MNEITESELESIVGGSFANDLGWAIGNIAGFLGDVAMAAYGNNPIPISNRIGILQY
jgi:bacteriocin-like protein